MDTVFLDTNAYGSYWAARESVFDVVSEAQRVHISMFVLAELVTGFKGGNRENENRKVLDEFLDKPSVELTFPTRRTTEYYALIKNQLRAKGKPIPTNDVWIAAQCLEHGAVLLSRDTHFEYVEGLRWKPF